MGDIADSSRVATQRRALLEDDSCTPWDIDGDVDIETAAFAERIRGVTSIKGSLTIALTDLEDLDFLSSLVCVGSDVYINSNSKLTSLAGLSSLVSVDRELSINFNSALTSLNGLDSLQSM